MAGALGPVLIPFGLTSFSAPVQEAGDAIRFEDVMDAGYAGLLTSGIGLAEALLPHRGYLFEDVFQFVDPLLGKGTYGLISTDRLSFTDSLLQAVMATIAEGLGLGSTLSVARAIEVLDALGIASLIDGDAIYKLSIADQIAFLDEFTRFFGADLTDRLGFAETIQPLYSANVSLSEGLGLGSSLASHFVARVTVEEGIAFDDADAIKMIFAPVIEDGIEITGAYVSSTGAITTWAMNVQSGAVTEYQNYAFTSFARMGLKYIGASPTGLFELDGDDDAGNDIIASLRSGLAQLGNAQYTQFEAAYLGLRGGGDYLLKLVTGNGAEYIYSFCGHDMTTTKVNLGKGLRTRYFSWELESAGQDFDLDNIEFLPIIASRRV